MVFDTTRQFFEDYVNEGTRAYPLQRLFCGALAAVIAQTCTYPFDIVRRRMQSEIHSGTTRRYVTIAGVSLYMRRNWLNRHWRLFGKKKVFENYGKV